MFHFKNYSEESFFKRENESLFFNKWLLVGHSAELNIIGKYKIINISGTQIVIIRSNADTINAYLNICPHRGARLILKTQGIVSQFNCAYHNSKFSLMGMVSKPSQATCNLYSVQLKIWNGFIYICPNKNITNSSLFDQLDIITQGVKHRFTSDLISLSELTGSENINVNWKLYIENNLDHQHINKIHPEFYSMWASSIDAMTDDIIRTEIELPTSSTRYWSADQYLKILSSSKNIDQKDKKWWWFYIYPNAFIEVFPESINYYYVLPTDACSFDIHSHSVGQKNLQDLKALQFLQSRISLKIHQQDKELLIQIYKNLKFNFDFSPQLTKEDDSIKFFHHKIQSDLHLI